MTMLLKRYTVYGVMQEKTTFFITLAIWKIGPKLQISSAYPAYLTFFYDDIQKLVNSIAHLYPSLSIFILLFFVGWIWLYIYIIILLYISMISWYWPSPLGRNISASTEPLSVLDDDLVLLVLHIGTCQAQRSPATHLAKPTEPTPRTGRNQGFWLGTSSAL